MIYFLIGLGCGGAAGWWLARVRAAAGQAAEQAARAGLEADRERLAAELTEARVRLDAERAAASAARAELAAAQAAAAERIAALTQAHERAANEFKALSAAALQANNAVFLELARQTLGETRKLADADLEKRQQAIASLVQPLRETLGAVDAKIAALDKSRAESAAALGQQLQMLAQAQATLQVETARLSQALSSNTVAGAWGELQLRRVVELAGMTDYCDFIAQASAMTEEKVRLRPDLVVRLPGGQQIAVDAKAPNDAFREAAVAPDEAARKKRLAEHAARVAGHVNALASKAYWEQFQPSPEFVVLFLPGDQFLAGALAADPGLLERAADQKVLLATPVTLIALLKAAAYGWRQETAARNAEEIAGQARELYDRVAVFADHLVRIASGLENAVGAYNQAVGAFESRVLPAGRRLAELGAKGSKTLVSELPTADTALREVVRRR